MAPLNSTELTTLVDDLTQTTLVPASTSEVVADEDEYELNRFALICVYTPFIAISVVGNLLVIITYCRYEKIRAVPTNALIFSLSISDFLVGSLVLTINLVWVFRGYWLFGEIFCRLWSTLDYTVSYMSTVTMVLISVDRFMLITKGVNYKCTWTRKRVITVSVVCWCCTLILYLIVAFSMMGSNLVDFHEECELEFVYVVPFTIGILIWEFGIPLPLLITLNAWVYYKIYKRSTRLKLLEADISGSLNNSGSAGHYQDHSQMHATSQMDYSLPSVSSFPTTNQPTYAPPDMSRPEDTVGAASSQVPPTVSNAVSEAAFTGIQPHPRVADPRVADPRVADPAPAPSASNNRRIALRQRRLQFSKHRKAGVTLFILSGTYLICWLPYEIVSILQAMCGEDDCFSETTWEAVNGLLWCNSALNPFLYGLTNPQLRHHVWYLLRSLWCRRSNRIGG